MWAQFAAPSGNFLLPHPATLWLCEIVQCPGVMKQVKPTLRPINCNFKRVAVASLARLVEHALRKRMVVGSIPTGGFAVLPARCQLLEWRCPAHPTGSSYSKTEDVGESRISCSNERAGAVCCTVCEVPATPAKFLPRPATLWHCRA